jgi:membrane protease YdiL (CAAX protease family)
MIAYVIIGNSVGGLVFGWLYWKKGLESAFIAHIFAHVAMVIIEKISL